MSKLEDLVPPLELCRQIPEGKFDDSALVWYRATISGDYVCLPRLYKNVDAARTAAPAPTLAEILEALYKMSGSAVKVSRRCERVGCWWVSAWIDRNSISRQDMNNPATAALRLWLEVNGVASAPSEASDKTQNAGHNGMEVEQ